MKLNLNPFKKSPPPSIDAASASQTTPADASISPLSRGLVSVQDVIAPPALDVDFSYLKIGNTYTRTLFVAGYPRYVSANWLGPLINFDQSLQISMFIYPVEGKSILDDLRRKIAEMEAEIATDMQRGKVVDPATQAKLDDAQELQAQLVKGAERFFQFGLYITVPAASLAELDQTTKEVIASLGSLLIIAKTAVLQMEDAFKTTTPVCLDHLLITRNMDTTSLATTFPFTSSELSMSEGIMYGINEHNGSFVIFDRFSMENANTVVFAKSGAGKSYFVKLEILRYLMFGSEIIVIDPEAEYKNLCDAVGGQFVTFGFNSPAKINPFDLSTVYEEGENELPAKILSLHSLFKIIMGVLSTAEEAILDRALVQSYRAKGITMDPVTQKNESPLMEDLYKSLVGMEEPESKALADRLEKFVKGSFRGVFDEKSTIQLSSNFIVFSLRDMEEALRPIAMYIILDFVWTRIKRELKKRILVIDEAWYLMKYPDSATFIHGIAKRARKYFLGLTTITQDVEDFLGTDYGKAIISNSSIQVLMKQSTAAIDKVAQTFYLSQGEKQLLLSADVGEGIFFAGANHVAIRAIASPEEHQLITSKPEELIMIQRAANLPKPPIPSQPAQPPTNPSTSQTLYQAPVPPAPQAPKPAAPRFIVEPETPTPQ